jgi:Zn-dependent protease with chaperone function
MQRPNGSGLVLTLLAFVAIVTSAAAQDGVTYLDGILRKAQCVLPPDYITATEHTLGESLDKHPRLRGAAEKVAASQVFDATSALGLSAVRVSPKQLPKVWDTFARCAHYLDVKVENTELYVAGADQFSTFSWGYSSGRNLVVLSTRCLKEMSEPELEFVLAAELAHVAANHNLYGNVNRMILALKDSSFRQANGVTDRAVKDIFCYDIDTPFLGRLFGVPRVVAAMMGIGAMTSKLVSLATGWILQALDATLFKSLQSWSQASETSANRAAWLVCYLHARQNGLDPEAAKAEVLKIAGRTFTKFMLKDKELAEQVDLDALIAQGREMIAQAHAQEAARIASRRTGLRGLKDSFVAWVKRQLRDWFWTRAGFADAPAELRTRSFLEELVELIDYPQTDEFQRTMARIENPSPATAAATALAAVDAGLVPPGANREQIKGQVREVLATMGSDTAVVH